MPVAYHYANMAPAMARLLEQPSTPVVPQEDMQLPQVPKSASVAVPLSGYIPPTPSTTTPQQSPYMPQPQTPQTNPYMPTPGSQIKTQNIQAYMPQAYQPSNTYTSAMSSNNDFFNGIMSNMQTYANGRSKYMAPMNNNMGMGRQDVGTEVTSSNGKLGSLSSKYESNGDPGTVAHTKGDIGGASYGTYQLSTASGNAQKFANQYGGALKGKRAGTAAFDAAWKAEAKRNPEKFEAAQHKYIEGTHYAPAASGIKKATGLDVGSKSQALQDVVWSIGVQHGSGGAANIFRNAGVTSKMSDEQIIKRVYAERKKVDKYFSRSSSAIKKSVYNRFVAEESQALAMLRNGDSTPQKSIVATAKNVGSQFIGNSKYKWGGGRTQADIKAGLFDCSSFVHYALSKSGKNIGDVKSTTTQTLIKKGTAVKRSDMKPGDLIFFDTNRKNGHVGIYLGGNKWIGAQGSTGVAVVDMNDKYWKSRFKGNVRRV